MKPFACLISLGLLILAAAGCGNAPREAKAPARAKHDEQPGLRDAAPRENGELGEVAAVVAPNGAPKGGGGAGQKQGGGEQPPGQPIPRKIIYTAEVKLVVDDLPKHDAGISSAGGRAETKRAVAAERNAAEAAAADSPVS
jgi:hypothetical protein